MHHPKLQQWFAQILTRAIEGEGNQIKSRKRKRTAPGPAVDQKTNGTAAGAAVAQGKRNGGSDRDVDGDSSAADSETECPAGSGDTPQAASNGRTTKKAKDVTDPLTASDDRQSDAATNPDSPLNSSGALSAREKGAKKQSLKRPGPNRRAKSAARRRESCPLRRWNRGQPRATRLDARLRVLHCCGFVFLVCCSSSKAWRKLFCITYETER